MSSAVKESYFWQQVKGGLGSDDVDLDRIENSAGTGISDVNAVMRGCPTEVWLELKVFHGNVLHFRNSQRIWINRRVQLGSRVFVLARKDNDHGGATLLLYEGGPTVLSESTPLSDKKSFSLHEKNLPKPLYTCNKPFKWDTVRQIIFGIPH